MKNINKAILKLFLVFGLSLYVSADSSSNITLFPGHTKGSWKSWDTFAALKTDSTVVTWGHRIVNSSLISKKLTDVKTIFSTEGAFAALKDDGTVVTWGASNYGGDSSSVADKLTNVKTIFSTTSAFAALKTDGTVVTWGYSNWGGDSSLVAEKLTNVKTIFSTAKAFAALKDDGTVVTWGVDGDYGSYGGDSSSVADKLTNVKTIFSTISGFAALKTDGTVVTWGGYGGDSSSVAKKLTNVKTIFSTTRAFAALKNDGTVVTWGGYDGKWGEDSSSVAEKLTNVKTIFSTAKAFAALKDDGTVVTWGNGSSGGDSSSVADKLTNVKTIFSTMSAFAALKDDGTVVTWGSGGGDSSSVAEKLTNIKTIFSEASAFAALKNDGTVVTWGASNYGGDSSSVASKLTNIKRIFSTYYAFAALKDDGTVVTWGTSNYGGDSSSVADKLTNIKTIIPSYVVNSYNYRYNIINANAGKDKNITIGESVSFSGALSSSEDGNIISYIWKEGDEILSNEMSFTKDDFTVGTHIITLTVTDDKGRSASDEMVLRVTSNEKWSTDIKNHYIVDETDPFEIDFDTFLKNPYSLLDESEKEKKSINDYKKDYPDSALNITVSDPSLKLECQQIDYSGYPSKLCKIFGKATKDSNFTVTVLDTKQNLQYKYSVQLSVTKHIIRNIISDNAVAIINDGDVTRYPSFGFTATNSSDDMLPKCTFSTPNGKNVEMFAYKVDNVKDRFVCFTNIYPYYYGTKNDEVINFPNDANSAQNNMDASIVNAAKQGDFNVTISYANERKNVKVKVFDRNITTATIILEPYEDQSIMSSTRTDRFLIINDVVYTNSDIEGRKFYLGGDNKQGSLNKDFVFIKNGVWKLTFQGHELVIAVESKGMGSGLAFSVDGSNLEKNGDIIDFIVDPKSFFRMIMKKTFAIRESLTGTIFSRPPSVSFAECSYEDDFIDLINKKATSYDRHPCYDRDNWMNQPVTAAIRGTTVNFTKEPNKKTVINLIEGKVDVVGNDDGNITHLTDMTSLKVDSPLKKEIVDNVLTANEVKFLKHTSLTGIEANQTIGKVYINTNLKESHYYLLGKNVQYGYGEKSIFDNVAEGSYKVVYLPYKGYITPSPQEINITKDQNEYILDGNYTKAIGRGYGTIILNKGWNLVSLPVDMTLSQDDISSKFKDAKTIWSYKKGEWYAFSSNINTMEKIKKANINVLSIIPKATGFWVNNGSMEEINFNGNSYDIELASITDFRGWKLLGSGKDINVSEVIEPNSNIETIWKYVNGKWYLFSNDENIKSIASYEGFKTFDTIKSGEGFWVYKK